MTELLTGPLAQAIGLTLLHTLWQATIVAGILAAALALLRRSSAAVRYAIACGALALIVVFAIGTAVEIYTPAAQPVHATPAAQLTAPAAADTIVIGPMPSDTWQDRATALLATAREHVPQILLLWLAGVLLLSIRLAVSWWRAEALTRRNAIDADENWQRTAKRLAEKLGLERPVRLVVSAAVEVPSVVGWLKPVVLIAVSSVSGLTTEQLEMVLAHELAHVRRHDFLVNAIQSVVETLLFYNPAVWFISRHIRTERENCCDDLAVSVCGDAVAYARALAQLESMRVPAAAAAANGGSLISRVRRLVGSGSEQSLFSNGWTGAAAVTSFVLLVGLATAPLFAERPAAAEPQSSGTKVTVTPPPTPAKPATPPTPQADDDDDTDVVEVPPVPPVPSMIHIPPIHIAPRAFAVLAPRIRAEAFAMEFSDEDEKDNTPPGKLSVNDLISLKVQNVSPEYIQSMRNAGLGDLTIHQVVALKVQGVTPEYVSQMRAAGAPIKTAHDVVALKVQGVTPDFVKSLVSAGYGHLSVHDIVRLKVVGVNGDFIREMEKYKR